LLVFTDATKPFLQPKINPFEFVNHARDRTGERALMRHRVLPVFVDHMSTDESSLPVRSRRPSGLSAIAFITDLCSDLR
jgi:hypothetical protein